MDGSRFRNLRVYQVAMQMSVAVSRLVRLIPPDHRDLIWQIRRAARSVVLNIAEGAGEYAPMEKARIYRIARRSARETAAALDCAVAEELLEAARLVDLVEKLDHVIAMLTTMGMQAEARAKAKTKRPHRIAARQNCSPTKPRPRPRPGKDRDAIKEADE